MNLAPLQALNKQANIDLSGNDIANCHQLDELVVSYPNLIKPEKCLNIAALMVAININLL